MKRIYVAGPYSADNIMQVLRNIRNGINAGAELMAKGYAVFCPFLDFQFALGPWGDALPKAAFQANSMAFVECCHAMLVLGYSGGVEREIDRAKALRIPVFTHMTDLEKWANEAY